MKKRRDQIFEIGEKLIQLKESYQDGHRQKPQWKLIIVTDAPLAPLLGDDGRKEKLIIFSSGERTEERGAKVAKGAKSDNDGLDYEIEEREAIQNEGNYAKAKTE